VGRLIEIGGDRITERSEQNALLNLLIETERLHALSTEKAQKQLKEAWEWDD
jgi:hypothetical protein